MAVKTSSSQTPQELTSDQVETLKQLLLNVRGELLAKANERKEEGLYEISRDDLADPTDLASVETDQEMGLKLAEHDRHKLAMVERALRKIDENDGYGLCEGTGEPIGFRRLSIQPWVIYSLKYQEELERGRGG